MFLNIETCKGSNIGLFMDFQFGMMVGSKYYDTHEPWLQSLWKRSQSDANIRAEANSECFSVAVMDKT